MGKPQTATGVTGRTGRSATSAKGGGKAGVYVFFACFGDGQFLFDHPLTLLTVIGWIFRRLAGRRWS